MRKAKGAEVFYGYFCPAVFISLVTGSALVIKPALYVCGMKQLVRLMASRFTQVGFVQFLDSRVLMGFTQLAGSVDVIESLGADSADIGKVADAGVNLRLSAAVDTAAWASHNLDEMIVGLAVLYLGQKFFGIL